jgi:hypothetical protein
MDDKATLWIWISLVSLHAKYPDNLWQTMSSKEQARRFKNAEKKFLGSNSNTDDMLRVIDVFADLTVERNDAQNAYSAERISPLGWAIY